MPLTDVEIRGLAAGPKPVVHRDGHGLELCVTPAGVKSWRFRYRFRGKQRRIILGHYPLLGLRAARIEAAQLRALVLAGSDPERAREPESPPEPEQPESEGLDAVVESYFADNLPAWKASTARTYRAAIGTFTAWAASSKVLAVDALTPAALARFRAHVIALPRRAKAKGGGWHDVVQTSERRSAAGMNCELRAVATMLQSLRVAGRLPALTSDAIADNLRQLQLERAKPVPLRSTDLRRLLVACQRHDARHSPIGPLVVAILLGGFRLGEALRLEWSDIDLEEMTVRVAPGKTDIERTVDLSVSPMLARMFTLRRGKGRGRVFDFTRAVARDVRLRLIDEYDAPAFLWSTRHSRPGERSPPNLRSTCGCYLTCAPAIFESASVYMSAAQLGHTVQVAEKHYLGALRKIPKGATSLEAAMEIEEQLGEMLEAKGPATLRLVTSSAKAAGRRGRAPALARAKVGPRTRST